MEQWTRRDVLKAGVAAGVLGGMMGESGRARAGGYEKTLRVGVIGCGGRGTGAAYNCLDASPDVRIWALGDVFPDRLAGCKEQLAKYGDGENNGSKSDRGNVPSERCFTGFDAFKQVLATDVDLVILATAPHFRPIHFAAAVEAGKHIFVEKPVAVDPWGVRVMLKAGEEADRKGLCVVAGTQRRHETCYLEAMRRVHEGQIGRVVSASCSWNQGGLWMNPRKDEWSDMEWQLRNWLYFTWLSGDHIVEQHVHNLDVVQWAIGASPVRAMGMGGRQVRTDPAYGNVFDHFAIEYEYPEGVLVHSYARQIDGCASRVEETIHGTEGVLRTAPGRAEITGKRPWKFEGPDNEPYGQEHIDLVRAITTGVRINETRNVTHSTLVAIMGRLSAYTGKVVTWEQAMNLPMNLSPTSYELGPMESPSVAIPGKTALT